jgi:hypothetical protein
MITQNPLGCAAGLIRLTIILALTLAGVAGEAQTGTTNLLYATGFEASEGYKMTLTLSGQQQWYQVGSGGNGIITNAIANEGQQAFIGYSAPSPGDSFLSVWHPLNYRPLTNKIEIVKFTVWMAIVDSSTPNRDDFRWTVYNLKTNQLFSIIFDNDSLLVSYQGDGDASTVATGSKFTNDTVYELIVAMDFQHNLWSATLNQDSLVQNLPISSRGAPLTLGDIDAAWVLGDSSKPGDNYMIFDRYRITVESSTAPTSPRLAPVSRLPDGAFLLRVIGQPNQPCILDATADFRQWVPIRTNSTGADGIWDVIDSTASGQSRRFYRSRLP